MTFASEKRKRLKKDIPPSAILQVHVCVCAGLLLRSAHDSSRHSQSPLYDSYCTIANTSCHPLGQHGAPEDLLGSGHHFRDEPGGRGRRPGVVQRERLTPMREMMKKVADLDLSRPTLWGVLD